MPKSNMLPPGTNVGRRGGIYQEVGPRGGPAPNYATVPENKRLPPTTEPGHGWKPIDTTPHGHRPKS
jgi:hypothetical protein